MKGSSVRRGGVSNEAAGPPPPFSRSTAVAGRPLLHHLPSVSPRHYSQSTPAMGEALPSREFLYNFSITLTLTAAVSDDDSPCLVVMTMGSKIKMRNRRAKSSLSIFIIVGLCFFFYVLGAWQKSGFGKGDSIALEITRRADCTNILSNLSFETHHNDGIEYESTDKAADVFDPCNIEYTEYTPCQDLNRATSFPLENLIYRERHCPRDDEILRCLIPAPKGYMAPFPWPISREFVPFVNVPDESLTVEKVFRSWVKFEGNIFKFPGREAMFSQGVDKYIEELASVIPLGDGTVRTALDTGCGVASWGAYLLSRNVLAMSFSPRDAQTAQVQFALERGIPAVIGVLGTIKLPYPARAFDMVHCSQCLIPWTGNGGMYMMEVDRVLRSGGYWILSGSPINWETYSESWNRSKEELQAEQEKIEKMAERLCWEKKYEKGDIAIWQKRKNSEICQTTQTDGSPSFCALPVSDDVWYKKMVACISPVPKVSSQEEVAGGALQKFPQRLFAVPPRISLGYIPDVTINMYQEDNRLWKKHVHAYKKINNLLDTGRYRNIMDMNAGFGSFAAYLESPTLWVMNVVPTLAKNTLGVIYERGLVGIYHDWCEGFSTYPRSYDLLHASGILSLYQNKCNLENILLEMDRILRPEGAVIFRDEVDVLNKVRKVVSGMRWNTKMMDHEDGPLVSEKILVAVKQYWTANATSATA